MSKKCRNCGFELADNMNFCPKCYSPYAGSAATDTGNCGNGGELEAELRKQLNEANNERTVNGLLSLASVISLGVCHYKGDGPSGIIWGAVSILCGVIFWVGGIKSCRRVDELKIELAKVKAKVDSRE